jgi:RND family efflux transporter MFP subunit
MIMLFRWPNLIKLWESAGKILNETNGGYPMKKDISIMVLIFGLLLFPLFSCQSQKESEEALDQSLGVALVKVYKVQRQRISEKLFYAGVIEAWDEVNITPDIGGKITKIHVEEGDRVQKGQLLAELDTRAVNLQLEQAKAGLAVAEANYKDAKRNKDRMERLIEENAVSEQQYDQVKLAYEAAEAQLQQAKATLNLANHNLEVSLMKAPFSGVIASKNAEEGDVINPMMGGFSPNSGVLTLMDFSQVKIDFDVSQQDVVRIQKGQTALLKVSAFPDRVFEGQVYLVNLTADPSTKKFKVEAKIDNPDLVLRPNTFGEVTLEVSTHEDALVIPQKAVLENKYVFVASPDNKAVRKEVHLGLQNTDMVEVTSGIVEGDLVLIEGNYGLEDGADIEIKEVSK